MTDAGTPRISDPGGKLVEAVARKFEASVPVIPIPGPSALIAALSASGLPADRFCFFGFPPHKKGRTAFFRAVAEQNHAVVLYESKHRIVKTLQALSAALQPA